MKVKNDHRSEFSNLSNWKPELLKLFALEVGFIAVFTGRTRLDFLSEPTEFS